MYTQCPHCLTMFEIGDDVVQAEFGIIRCVRCTQPFVALAAPADAPRPGTAAGIPHAADGAAPMPARGLAASSTIAAIVTTEPGKPPAHLSAPPGGAPPDPGSDDALLATLPNTQARALIADAAGVPREEVEDALDFIDTKPASPDSRFPPVLAVRDDGHEALNPDVPEASVDATAGPAPDMSWSADALDPSATGKRAIATTLPTAESLMAMPDGAIPKMTTRAPGAVARIVSAALAFPEVGPLDAGTAGNSAREPGTGAARESPNSAEAPEPSAAEAERTANTAASVECITPPETPALVYVPPRRRIGRREWLLGSGCVVLALVLAAQLLWAQRTSFLRNPATQALALRMCARIDCRLPPIRDTAKLELLSRDVRPYPGVRGALSITATFRNDAPFRQAWPIVVVELTDLDNAVVAMRRFRPAEYLANPARRKAGMPAGATAAVAFEVADPGKRAVAFHFGFD